ncbi:1-deoxy-D-xylulose-5-phosphate reductoisomerase [Calderihabitans maritimus]|uniref:1-deoxy-D-xylulose 5-phosphate reductoisomerase n=1 Tax=Calderihabitans maritimus TaxID=1246530 RepID=A0A1Z5HXS7_9FIRM|nr:1-deoxy-D-xylulose-5-phosphate reductoisomerase [Calderihabitans maritimus]GAW94314.1 1-deoxy-D-xylulose 5-phosphate reductoisomerase [Calderihabitans maritimus]
MIKKVAILGSTGSIGQQTLEVIDLFSEKFQVLALAGGRNIELLEEQTRKYRPGIVAVMDPERARELRLRLGDLPVKVLEGLEGLCEIARLSQVEIVVMAVSGVVGLLPTLEAVNAGKTVALANKETLVAGGSLVMRAAREKGAIILPVDSEHSAIFQCLLRDREGISSLLLTASGGPFRGYTKEQLRRVTPREALRHPNWEMGRKITIDSATLMNKGLEVIEARWLFDVDYDKIQVVVHPQSIIHSMVSYIDGSVIAYMSVPDMRIPIQYALSWPERWNNNWPKLDFFALREITFEEPNVKNFPCLDLAYQAGRIGGTMPAVLNAANEVAVKLFLQNKIGFLEIPRLIEETMGHHQVISNPDLGDILESDQEARQRVKALAK